MNTIITILFKKKTTGTFGRLIIGINHSSYSNWQKFAHNFHIQPKVLS